MPRAVKLCDLVDELVRFIKREPACFHVNQLLHGTWAIHSPPI